MKHDIKEFNHTLNGKLLVSYVTEQVGYRAYVKMYQDVMPLVTPSRRLNSLVSRKRLATQVTFQDSEDKGVQLTDEQITVLPAKLAKQILDKLDGIQGEMGKIIRDGDGVTKPILYQLGQPLTFAKGDPIKELEIMCRYYGDIEDTLAEDFALAQTLTFLASCAKPVSSTLQTIPESTLDQLSFADGLFVLKNILPRFLE